MSRFYDLDAASERLREVRPLLEGLRRDRERLAALQAEMAAFKGTNGNASHAQEVDRREREITTTVRQMEGVVRQLDGWDVTLRDIGSGLIDFPALASGRPIWLCWRLGEEGIGWWHETTEGFAGRKPLGELT
ncbi:MAG: DUF2203 domain-containing protein [Candidatus Limnocylindrales bacterium]